MDTTIYIYGNDEDGYTLDMYINKEHVEFNHQDVEHILEVLIRLVREGR